MMSTIFPREDKSELLFKKILEDEDACARLSETFYGAIDPDQTMVGGYLKPQEFAKALFDAYTNRDLSALLMALTQNSMFDLLRNSYLAPFRFNEDGKENPIILTDDDGNLRKDLDVEVPEADYERFHREFRHMEDCKMYLAHGCRLNHAYDEKTMDVVEMKSFDHYGVLLIYDLPDTVKQQETEAQAYAAVLDIVLKLQKEFPSATVYYGQDVVKKGERGYDELGVFLHKHLLKKNFNRNLEVVTKILHGEKI